jgi:DNA repair protein RadA/Sms
MKSSITKTIFACIECGYESAKWSGRCPVCGAGNTMVEEIRELKKNKNLSPENFADIPVRAADIKISQDVRFKTNIKEFDRVLGGGIVKGSLVLMGGAPGIGKSTVLLQLADKFKNVLYISGEESKSQIKMRASRLGIKNPDLLVMTETNVNAVAETIKKIKPDLAVIDSIQTMVSDDISSGPGGVSQVKECASILLKTAKKTEIPIVIVSHINKDGIIAGPKVLEHIVDTVLYFEDENKTPYRLIRAVKNRYGSSSEIGIFQMTRHGLIEVPNPSAMLLTGRTASVSGTCVACCMEGSRAILAEVQALAASVSFGVPKRVAAGFDYNRLCLILAVLEKRAGFHFANADVYVNVVGGIKLADPAADLAMATALISSLKDIAVSENTLVFGEIGLSGEIRPVSYARERIAEARRLGFTKCLIPKQNANNTNSQTCIPLSIIREISFYLQK